LQDDYRGSAVATVGCLVHAFQVRRVGNMAVPSPELSPNDGVQPTAEKCGG